MQSALDGYKVCIFCYGQVPPQCTDMLSTEHQQAVAVSVVVVVVVGDEWVTWLRRRARARPSRCRGLRAASSPRAHQTP